MSEDIKSARRQGGRAARRALRAAPPAEHEKAVTPGLSGGRYRPLDDAEIARVHTAVLDVLEQIGLANATITVLCSRPQ